MIMSLKKLKHFLNLGANKSNLLKSVQVGNYKLSAPKEHQIEYHLKDHQYYSRNLPRIAKYVERKYPHFNIIDVGANIGDTIALFRSAGVNQQIYAIEGEPFYFDLLEQNLSQFNNVKAFEVFLGEETQLEGFLIEANQGTAKLNIAGGKTTQLQKLDDFIQEHQISDIKLLKIDTDGFDLKILRGSLELIKNHQPILFFEYDADYLEEQGENGISIFKDLQKLEYDKILFYDNYGKLLIAISVDKIELIEQLYAYIRKKEGAFQYYDVCVFHKNDEELANEVIRSEMQFFA